MQISGGKLGLVAVRKSPQVSDMNYLWGKLTARVISFTNPAKWVLKTLSKKSCGSRELN